MQPIRVRLKMWRMEMSQRIEQVTPYLIVPIKLAAGQVVTISFKLAGYEGKKQVPTYYAESVEVKK